MYGVSESVLRAMVECSFLSELEGAQSFTEEEPRPLTRTQFLQVLKTMRRVEEARVDNVKHPSKVPDAKWAEKVEKVEKARGKTRVVRGYLHHSPETMNLLF